MLDNLSRVPGNFTGENLKSDIDNLYDMGVGLATEGITNLGDALLQSSSFHDLMGGKVGEIINLYDHYGDLFERAENDLDVYKRQAVLRCCGVADWACPDIAHYNYTLRFRSCGLSRGAGLCPVPLMALP